jgi:hypothetical protein
MPVPSRAKKMTERDSLLAKNPKDIKFPVKTRQGAIYKDYKSLKSGTPTNPSEVGMSPSGRPMTTERKKMVQDKNQKFPATTKSGTVYSNKQDAWTGTPTNPKSSKPKSKPAPKLNVAPKPSVAGRKMGGK